jgi:hypothetical protein
VAPLATNASTSSPPHTTLATLTLDEREVYKLLYNEYKDNLSLVKQQIESLRQIRNHIMTSTGKDNIVYLKGKTTIYNMLVALKKRLAPTDDARKIEVATKYSKLRVFDKKTDLEAWCRSWETTYLDVVGLNLLEVAEDRAQYDFTTAITAVDESYVITQQFYLRQATKTSTIPTLYDLVEDFRNHRRRATALKSSPSHSAFTVLLNGQTADGDDAKPEKPARPCLCGKAYGYRACYYLTPSTRPVGWTGKKEIFEEINNKVNNLKNRHGKPSKDWILDTFKYDGYASPPVTSTTTTTGSGNTSDDKKALGSFTTYSSF